MKTHSNKFFIVSGILFILFAFTAFYLFSVESKNIAGYFEDAADKPSKSVSKPSINTNGEEDEVPHFNLFSIINKFIPH